MKDRDIEEAVQKLAGTYLKDIVSVVLCNVTSVDKDNRVCDCKPIGGNADTTIPKVRLMAENDDGFLVLPAIDSTVMVALSSRGYAYVFMYSSIDEAEIVIGTTGNYTSYNIKSGLQKFNDGSFDGIPKVIELTKKINALESKVNDILIWSATHTHAGVTAGFVASGVAISAGAPLTPTMKSEIENPLIIHGK